MVSKEQSAEKSVVYFASAKVARLDGRATANSTRESTCSRNCTVKTPTSRSAPWNAGAWAPAGTRSGK